MLEGGGRVRARSDFQTLKSSITRRGGVKLVLENSHRRRVEKSKAPDAYPVPGAPGRLLIPNFHVDLAGCGHSTPAPTSTPVKGLPPAINSTVPESIVEGVPA